MQNVINMEEDEEILKVIILNPIVIFKGARLQDAISEMYKSDLYPMMIVKDNNPLTELIRPYLPRHLTDIKHIIVPIKYTKEFLA